ncbi:MAG: hypothetical protein ACLS7Z_01305 [Christensenellales bacterium]
MKLGEGEQRVPLRRGVYPRSAQPENALAAVTIAGVMGVSCETMREVLKTFKGVEHRIETVRELDGVTWINDSKGTNVDSTRRPSATMNSRRCSSSAEATRKCRLTRWPGASRKRR